MCVGIAPTKTLANHCAKKIWPEPMASDLKPSAHARQRNRMVRSAFLNQPHRFLLEFKGVLAPGLSVFAFTHFVFSIC